MLQILCDNKDGNAFALDASNVTLDLSRAGSPGKLTLTIPPRGDFSSEKLEIAMGATISFRLLSETYNYNNSGYDKNYDLFFGYVFATERSQNGEISITAYDQLKYLLNKDTYVFGRTTVTEMLRKFAADFGIKTGVLEETGYYLSSKVHDNSSLLDMLQWGVNETLLATGNYYVIYDNFGKLSLQNIRNLTTNILIGDTSELTSVSYKESIDSDATANRIKIEKDDEEAGVREIYVAQDAGNQSFWGVLQYFEKAQDGLTKAEIIEKTHVLLNSKNKPARTLSLSAIGFPGLFPGQYVYVFNEKLGINGYFNITEITHKWEKSVHTMDLDVMIM